VTVSTDSDEGDVCVAQFDKIRGFLAGAGSMGWEHSAVENYVRTEGFELLRLLLQDHFDRRAQNKARRDVTDATGVRFGAVERGHDRALSTVVGQVPVTRLAYRHRGAKNLYPADGVANLPDEQYSHGLRQLTAIEAARAETGRDRAPHHRLWVFVRGDQRRGVPCRGALTGQLLAAGPRGRGVPAGPPASPRRTRPGNHG